MKDARSYALCRGGDQAPLGILGVVAGVGFESLLEAGRHAAPMPPLLHGCSILVLGRGAGEGICAGSKLAWARGVVTGRDEGSGPSGPAVELCSGGLEDLSGATLEDASMDVVVANSILNVTADRVSVFQEIFRVLKPGGEFYFSDVFSGRRVPKPLREHPGLRREGLAGAMYIEDFRRMLRDLGCPDYRIVSARGVQPGWHDLRTAARSVDFRAVTLRAFKLANLEDICEDYGQVAVYKGTVPGLPHYFDLDDHHRFVTGKPRLVCGNTASMLQSTRFGSHFSVQGDRSVHFGPFVCGSPS